MISLPIGGAAEVPEVPEDPDISEDPEIPDIPEIPSLPEVPLFNLAIDCQADALPTYNSSVTSSYTKPASLIDIERPSLLSIYNFPLESIP